MASKTDRRVRKTKAQLRAGLAKLMQKKSIKEITVKELVEEVDINRSTFYLHYTDIYHMLDSIEQELLEEITRVIDTRPIGLNENTFPFIADIFSILEANREICTALMGPNGDSGFIYQIEEIIEANSMKALSACFSGSLKDLKYSYAFCLTGCIGLVKEWLLGGGTESPEHMARLTYAMVFSSLCTFAEASGQPKPVSAMR